MIWVNDGRPTSFTRKIIGSACAVLPSEGNGPHEGGEKVNKETSNNSCGSSPEPGGLQPEGGQRRKGVLDVEEKKDVDFSNTPILV